uniref:Uncharacterized protein n=1 Tax=Chromera velia CCMP2878 TaxID=1169474 RepID=A0A0G4GDH7_9ALVE|eukprot:Cvel_4549.t1-p1 / transcript=Cvel_4549.t1 / gene=Cvel_4549 / organism=Chromera_velia_CCMP2878 / gene_product=Uncharacterized protein C11orf65, putative / transcript_product=Uncharacterized protein C11orf65, putative / location=Cvel_scaffold199:82010-86161(+) / protein_length=735 / sequence_SO=supercontig / SO=protein_coding / is_pseudo=false
MSDPGVLSREREEGGEQSRSESPSASPSPDDLQVTNQATTDEGFIVHTSTVKNQAHYAAFRIQKCWGNHCDRKIFKVLRDVVNFRLQGNPSLLLRCINPREAHLLDPAAQCHVRFRLGGTGWPPQLYYKIFVHGPLIDINAFAPRDYRRLVLANGRERKEQLLRKFDRYKTALGAPNDTNEAFYREIEFNSAIAQLRKRLSWLRKLFGEGGPRNDHTEDTKENAHEEFPQESPPHDAMPPTERGEGQPAVMVQREEGKEAKLPDRPTTVHSSVPSVITGRRLQTGENPPPTPASGRTDGIVTERFTEMSRYPAETPPKEHSQPPPAIHISRNTGPPPSGPSPHTQPTWATAAEEAHASLSPLLQEEGELLIWAQRLDFARYACEWSLLGTSAPSDGSGLPLRQKGLSHDGEDMLHTQEAPQGPEEGRVSPNSQRYEDSEHGEPGGTDEDGCMGGRPVPLAALHQPRTGGAPSLRSLSQASKGPACGGDTGAEQPSVSTHAWASMSGRLHGQTGGSPLRLPSGNLHTQLHGCDQSQFEGIRGCFPAVPSSVAFAGRHLNRVPGLQQSHSPSPSSSPNRAKSPGGGGNRSQGPVGTGYYGDFGPSSQAYTEGVILGGAAAVPPLYVPFKSNSPPPHGSPPSRATSLAPSAAPSMNRQSFSTVGEGGGSPALAALHAHVRLPPPGLPVAISSSPSSTGRQQTKRGVSFRVTEGLTPGEMAEEGHLSLGPLPMPEKERN